MRLSYNGYRLIGKTTAVMGAVIASTGVYLVLRETDSPVVVLFMLSWGATFLAVAYCAYLKLALMDLEARP